MPLPGDPFGLQNLIRRNTFGITTPLPGDPTTPNPNDPPWDGPVRGGPHNTYPDSLADIMSKLLGGTGGGGGGIGSPLIPSTKSSTKLTGFNAGRADLSGASDLINNIAFQRLWEGYNPGQRVDAPGFDFAKTLTANASGPSGFTRHQGDGAGWLWGYVDPTWLKGYNPGRSVTTIQDILGTPPGGGDGADKAARLLAWLNGGMSKEGSINDRLAAGHL